MDDCLTTHALQPHCLLRSTRLLLLISDIEMVVLRWSLWCDQQYIHGQDKEKRSGRARGESTRQERMLFKVKVKTLICVPVHRPEEDWLATHGYYPWVWLWLIVLAQAQSGHWHNFTQKLFAVGDFIHQHGHLTQMLIMYSPWLCNQTPVFPRSLCSPLDQSSESVLGADSLHSTQSDTFWKDLNYLT